MVISPFLILYKTVSVVNSNEIAIFIQILLCQNTGADSGICVTGGVVLYWRGVWGPPRPPAGPGQRRGGGVPECLGNSEFEEFM